MVVHFASMATALIMQAQMLACSKASVPDHNLLDICFQDRQEQHKCSCQWYCQAMQPCRTALWCTPLYRQSVSLLYELLRKARSTCMRTQLGFLAGGTLATASAQRGRAWRPRTSNRGCMRYAIVAVSVEVS